MADKSFGAKEINLLGSGTPTIDSPNNLNINAVNVAISTDLSVGGKISLGAGTSISSPGTNILTLGTNNAERLRINSIGYIGVGTDNPQERLHVARTIIVTGNTPQIRLNANDSDASDDDRSMLGQATGNSHFVTTAADNDTILRGTATGNLLFGVGTSEKVRITSDGDLLPGADNTQEIGSSSKYWKKIYVNEIQGASTITGTISNATNATNATNADNVNINNITSSETTAKFIHFGDLTNGYDGVEVDATTLVYRNKKLGIGTDDPEQKLDVVGSGHTVSVFRPDSNALSGYGSASVVNNLINLRMPYGTSAANTSNSGARWGIKFQGRNDDADYGTDTQKSASIYAVSEDTLGYNRQVGLAFYTSDFDTNQTENLRITHDGTVQLSNLSSTYTSGTATRFSLYNDTNNHYGFHVGGSFDLNYNAGGSVASGKGEHVFHTAAAERLRITSGGLVGIGTNDPKTKLHVESGTGFETRVTISQQKSYGAGTGTTERAGLDLAIREPTVTADNRTFARIETGPEAETSSNASFLSFSTRTGGNIGERLRINSSGHLLPGANGSQDLGSSSKRWNTIYANSIDGTPTGTISNATNATNVNITDDTGNSGTHYVHFGSATSGFDEVEVDSNGLVYKDGKIGVGTNNPSAKLDVRGNLNLNSDGTAGFVSIIGARTNNGNNAFFEGRCSRGTIASPETLIANDVIATFNGLAHDGSNYLGAGRVRFSVSGISTGDLDSDLQFWVSNNGEYEALRIKSDGKVGIGTDNPQEKLHVLGTSSDFVVDTDSSVLRFGSYGEYDIALVTGRNAPDGSSRLYIENGNGEALRITSDGTLEVKGDANPNAVFDRGSANTTNVNFNYNGTLTGQLGAANSEFQISAAGSNTPLTIFTNGTEKLRITSDGKVGVGITDPTALLHVQNDSVSDTKIIIESTGADSYPALRLKNDSRSYDLGIDGATDAFRVYDVTGSAETLSISTDGKVELYYDNDPKLETNSTGVKINGALEVTGQLTYDDVTNIDSVGIITAQSDIHVFKASDGTSGSVGIGTDNPLKKLDIRGSLGISKSTDTSVRTTITSGPSGLIVNHGDNSAVIVQNTGTEILRITNDGNIQLSDLSSAYTSGTATRFSLLSDTNNHYGLHVGNTFDLNYNAGGSVASGKGEHVFHTAAAERLRITSGGLVGINTTNPSKLLHVHNGDIRVTNADKTNFVELTTDGNVEIKRTGGGAFIDFADATNQDFDARIQHNSGLDFYTGIHGVGSGPQLRLGISTVGHLIPGANGSQDLGSSTKRWDNIYANSLNFNFSDNNITGRVVKTATGTNSDKDYWAKIATFSTGTTQFNDGTIILAVTNEESSNMQTAIISVFFRSNATNSNPTVGVEILSRSGLAYIKNDSFKVISGGWSTDMQLWMQKGENFGGFAFYEISRNISSVSGVSLTYHDGATWQSSEPSGSINNVTPTSVPPKFSKYSAYNTVLEESGFISYYAITSGSRPHTSSAYWSGIQSLLFDDTKYGWQLIGNSQSGQDPELYIRKIENNSYPNSGAWTKILTQNDDRTYSISMVAGDATNEKKLKLISSNTNESDDEVIFAAGTGLSLTRNGQKITFANTDTGSGANTTYSLKAQQTNSNDNNPNIFLDGSSGTDSSIQLVGSGSVSVTRNNDGQITISGTDTNTDTNTTYDLTVEQTGGTNDNPSIKLNASAGDDDEITITGGTNISVTRNSSTQLTIATSGTLSGTTSQADKIKISTNSNAAEKNVVFVDSGTTNGQYKSLQIDNDKTLTFNPDTDTLTATTFAGNLTGTATTATNANNSRIQTNSNNSAKKIVFVGANTSDGDYKPLQVDNNDKLTFNPSTNVLTVANLTVGIGTEEPTTTIGGQPAFVCRHFGRIESDGDISGGTNGGSGTFSSSRTADGVYSISFNTGNKPSDANYCVNVTTLDEGSDHIVGVKDVTVNGFTVRSIDSGAHSGGGESGYDDSPFMFSVFY